MSRLDAILLVPTFMVILWFEYTAYIHIYTVYKFSLPETLLLDLGILKPGGHGTHLFRMGARPVNQAHINAIIPVAYPEVCRVFHLLTEPLVQDVEDFFFSVL